MFDLGDTEFICDKCKQSKSTEGALLHRDPRIDYCLCQECRDQLVQLIQENEYQTICDFLHQKEDLILRDYIAATSIDEYSKAIKPCPDPHPFPP